MPKPSSWRELLRHLTSNPDERERIANEIGVRPITLSRWIQGISNPRLQNIRQLLLALPQPSHDQFLELLREEHPDLSFSSFDDDAQDEIEYQFILRVFEARATTPDVLRFWTLYRQVLQHALRRLDSDQVGMAITVAQCMPPSREGKVRSLRESAGMGTSPWRNDLEYQGMLLGSESLAGYVVSTCRREAIERVSSTQTLLPASQTEHEVSAMASPILYGNRVAGCLLFSSTQPNYFLSEDRRMLIQGYTHLIALAFEPEQFYSPECIELQMMPPRRVQQTYFATFRQRVHAIMQTAFTAAQPLTVMQAEQMTWQQLEEEMMYIAFSDHRDAR